MSHRRAFDPQFDLFVPYITELPLRDQRETMERPFFSLAKRKRLKPIEYVSPNGEIFVNVYPNQEFGMATIWDLDILIWAASIINDLKRKGANDIPRTLPFQPYDLLKTICRPTGGYEYRRLRDALGRLQATTVVTNIRAKKNKKQAQFSWIESWTDLQDEDTGESKGMTLTLSEWFYEGIIMDGGLLSIDPTYFSITGGRERWLYRVARKHAGGAGEDGFPIPLPTLFEKSGAEGTYRRFKFEMQALVKRNELPGFDLALEYAGAEPVLRMTRRALSDPAASEGASKPRPARGENRKGAPEALPLFHKGSLGEEMIERIRRDFPGWDVYALQAEFDAWIAQTPSRKPKDYEAAFYGFVRTHHSRAGGAGRS